VALKRCRVRFRDLEGVRHEVQVDSQSLFDAVAKGLKALRKNDWSGSDAWEATWVEVTVTEPEVVHSIEVKAFEKWLEHTPSSPKDITLRQRIRKILEG
jgi:hypothetical protein